MWRASDLRGCGIRATDGAVGSIADLLFDDENWTIRWAVVDTGAWIPGRRVLLPPSVLGEPDSLHREIPVDLDRERIKDSPGVDTDAPVSRQLENEVYSHYGWDPYWGAGYGYPPVVPAIGAAGGVPPMAGVRYPHVEESGTRAEPRGDLHLRSVNEVTGYHVHATDGDIGHVEDFLIEPENWHVRYLVVDTKNWWPGKMVLVSPEWFRDVSWSEEKVFVDLTREKVKSSPEYLPELGIDRGYEERLHGYYGYPAYWGTGAV